MILRPATPADAPAIAALYAPFVTGTAITLELEPPDAAEIAARMEGGYPWRVAEVDGAVAGYASAGVFRVRAGYRHTAETSVYVAEAARRQGIAAALYAELIAALAGAGITQAIATITLPNPASVAFHEACGFAPAGVLRQVGRKFDRWFDVGLWQRAL